MAPLPGRRPGLFRRCRQHRIEAPEAFGAYLLLMMAQWRNEGQPLPDNDRKLA
ncbi:MAG TPA: DUF1376 domain-containing protein [Rhodospirillales bacterium]|nr:DUF1376 domain-containing protein [Rhodospirillales bacterium]